MGYKPMVDMSLEAALTRTPHDLNCLRIMGGACTCGADERTRILYAQGVFPPVPSMTSLDEEWIEWAAGTFALSTNQTRGMLAAWYTMRARSLAKGIESLRREIAQGEATLKELQSGTLGGSKLFGDELALAEKDIAMYTELLPQLRELAR